jgi:Response regulator containing a CheY-like receiver domain and an HTH DNA-binding domain
MVTLTQVGSVPPQIHLLIVDQQRTFRDALAIRLRAEPDVVVTADAQSTESGRRVLAGRSTDGSCSMPNSRTIRASPSAPR